MSIDYRHLINSHEFEAVKAVAGEVVQHLLAQLDSKLEPHQQISVLAQIAGINRLLTESAKKAKSTTVTLSN